MVYIYLLVFVVFINSLIKTQNALHMFQLEHYHLSRYKEWLGRNKHKILSLDELLVLVALVIVDFNYHNYFLLAEVIVLTFYVVKITIMLSIKGEVKKQFKITNRVKRLINTWIILLLIGTFIAFFDFESFPQLLVYNLLILSISSYLLIFIMGFINKPMEKYFQGVFIKEAKIKLKKINPTCIGITGSYGKTSTKVFMGKLLESIYNPFVTPDSYNTTMGVTLAINNMLKRTDDFFISEMGAYYPGDIEEICDIVSPKIGVITAIGPQHLNTFGTIENIQKTKFELIESLPSDGLAVINVDYPYVKNYQIKNDCKVVTFSIKEESDYQATNITYNNNGTFFELKHKDNVYSFQTKLLGRHNIYNLIAGIIVGFHLGISYHKLKVAVSKIKAIPHRLELKRYNNLTIIDDAFNANPVGISNALDVLSSFNNQKVIVTPGMIDLGSKEKVLNYQLGLKIAEVCDKVYLINPKQTKAIYQGLKDSNYDMKKVVVLNEVKRALHEVYQLNDATVLIANDLPDNY